MALVKLDLHPPAGKLRDFGDIALCMCVILALLGNWLFGWSFNVVRGLVLAGLAVYLLSRCSTRLVLPIYRALMLLSFPIGWLISHLVLGLFYYLVICAIGLFFRIIGRDVLQRKYDPKADSYWMPCEKKKNSARYFQQF